MRCIADFAFSSHYIALCRLSTTNLKPAVSSRSFSAAYSLVERLFATVVVKAFAALLAHMSLADQVVKYM